MRIEIRALAPIIIPLVSILAVLGFAVGAMSVCGPDEGHSGPMYRLRNGRVVDDLAAIQSQVDFEILEPQPSLIPWPLQEVSEGIRIEGSSVTHLYHADDGGTLSVSQAAISAQPLPPLPGNEVNDLIVDGTRVRRTLVAGGSMALQFDWIGCEREFSVRTEPEYEEIAVQLLANMIGRCG